MKLVKIEEDRLAKEQEKRIAREQQAEVDMASNYNSSAKSYSLSLKDYTSLVVNVDTLLRDHRSLNSWHDSLDKMLCNSLIKLAGAFTSTLKDSVNGDVESSIVPEDID